jgi:ankyrin repeat protein
MNKSNPNKGNLKMDKKIYSNSNTIYNCSVNTKCKGFTRLMHAIAYNLENYIITETDLKEINKKNELGWTALMICCANDSNNINLIDLLKNGANVNLKNIGGNTALIFAVIKQKITFIQLLLEYAADPNIKNNDGWSALLVSCTPSYSGSPSILKIVDILLQGKANINIINNEGWTALMLISRFTQKNNSFEILKFLIEKGAKLDIKKNNGTTTLMMASRFSDKDSSLETVNALLEAGANPNIQNNIGDTALIMATQFSNTETVNALLEAGANPNIQNNNGDTALYSVCYLTTTTSRVEKLKALLKYNANVNLINNQHYSVIMYLYNENADSNVLELLIRNNAKYEQNIYTIPIILKIKDEENKILLNKLESKIKFLKAELNESIYSPFPGKMYLDTMNKLNGHRRTKST